MEKKLQRNLEEKRIAGVCAGLADYFSVDVTLVRLAFLAAFIAGLSGVFTYIIFWIIMPAKASGFKSKYQTSAYGYQDSYAKPNS